MRYGWIEVSAVSVLRARSRDDGIRRFLRTVAVFTLFAVALGGCVAFGRTPVTVTVEGELKGHRFHAERSFECVEYTRRDLGCYGCSKWRATQTRLAIPFPGGGGVAIRFGDVCNRDGSVSMKRRVPIIAWADDLSDPTYVESYPSYAKNGRRHLRFPVDGHPAWYSVAVERDSARGIRMTELDGQTTWNGRERGDKFTKNPRVLACFGAIIHREDSWRTVPRLVELIGDGGPTRILRPISIGSTVGHIKRALAAISTRASRTTEEGARLPVYSVPLRRAGQHWVPDYSKPGMAVCRYVGIQDDSIISARIIDGRLNYYEWSDSQKALADDVIIPMDESPPTYVSSLGAIVYFGSTGAFRDFEH